MTPCPLEFCSAHGKTRDSSPREYKKVVTSNISLQDDLANLLANRLTPRKPSWTEGENQLLSGHSAEESWRTQWPTSDVKIKHLVENC